MNWEELITNKEPISYIIYGGCCKAKELQSNGDINEN